MLLLSTSVFVNSQFGREALTRISLKVTTSSQPKVGRLFFVQIFISEPSPGLITVREVQPQPSSVDMFFMGLDCGSWRDKIEALKIITPIQVHLLQLLA